jgi:hypothetical protein
MKRTGQKIIQLSQAQFNPLSFNFGIQLFCTICHATKNSTKPDKIDISLSTLTKSEKATVLKAHQNKHQMRSKHPKQVPI